MTRKYEYTTTVCIGTDGEDDFAELEVTFAYNVQGSERATYDCPGSGAAVIDLEVKSIAGYTLEVYLIDLILEEIGDSLDDAFLESAGEDEQAREDDYYEDRYERMRDEA